MRVLVIEGRFDFKGNLGSSGKAVLFFSGVNGAGKPVGFSLVVAGVAPKGTALIEEVKSEWAEPVGVSWHFGLLVRSGDVL